MGVFDGQVALVTGCGSERGIGFACAEALGAEGATVAITSTTDRIHERAAELRARGIGARGLVADLTDPEQVAALVDEVLDGQGQIDVCVNNAGLLATGEQGSSALTWDLDLGVWEAGLARNLTTCLLVTRAVLPAMRARRYGRIVNIASTSGVVAVYPGDVTYQAAKAGMTGLTKAVAVEVAADGITVNAVAPGWIATAVQSPRGAEAGRHTPVGRSGRADEIATITRWLADPNASYITGQTVVVDGGNSLPEVRR